ncbi:MAG: transglycosylase domain-containing protein [Clostridiales bacterium]|nr:MAG: transglycosylase domain-containing protein [Clostridiales bacterium]
MRFFRALELEKRLINRKFWSFISILFISVRGATALKPRRINISAKSIKELDLAECASIAGITQYPTLYEPLGNPEENKKKQHLVLDKNGRTRLNNRR